MESMNLDDEFLDQPAEHVGAEDADRPPTRGDPLRRSTSLGELDGPDVPARGGDHGSEAFSRSEEQVSPSRSDRVDVNEPLSRSESGGRRSSAPTFRPPIRRYDSDEAAEPLDGGGGPPSAAMNGSSSSSSGGNARSASMSAAPPSRRTSTGDLGETDKRALIRDILRDPSLSQLEKRRTVQHLMDGRSRRRITIDCGRTNPYLDKAKKRPSQCEGDGVPSPEEQAELRRLLRGGNGGGGSGGGDSNAPRSTSAGVGGENGGGAPTAQPLVMQRPRRRRRTIDSPKVNPPDPARLRASILGSPDATPPPPVVSASFGSGGNTSGRHSSRRASMETIHSENTEPSRDDEYMRVDSADFGASEREHSKMSVTDELDCGTGCDDRIARLREAAIAEVRSQVRQEDLASSHPYKSDRTAVPAVAAGSTAGPSPHSSIEVSRRAIETAPTCTHYERNCHIVSPCCGATFGCRICHDDCPVLPPPLEYQCVAAGVSGGGKGGMDGGDGAYRRVLRTASMPSDLGVGAGPPEHHAIDRFAIREVICRECYTRQGSKRNSCVNCGVAFGQYHCAICNLWMSNEERPYHCPDCGFCRVGGGENFVHCNDCGMCIDRHLFDGHNCKVGKYMSNCPVCQEDLFSSRDASHELPCGHAIHWHCFRQLAGHDSRCPICKKTAETHDRMRPTWDAMAMGIALQPVPPELCKVVTIKCFDCEAVQDGRAWHFLGVQCDECESFNTVVERIERVGQEAHEHLLRVGSRGLTPPPAGGGTAPPSSGGAQMPSLAGFSSGVNVSSSSSGRAGGTVRRPRRRRATVATDGNALRQTPPPPFGH